MNDDSSDITTIPLTFQSEASMQAFQYMLMRLSPRVIRALISNENADAENEAARELALMEVHRLYSELRKRTKIGPLMPAHSHEVLGVRDADSTPAPSAPAQ